MTICSGIDAATGSDIEIAYEESRLPQSPWELYYSGPRSLEVQGRSCAVLSPAPLRVRALLSFIIKVGNGLPLSFWTEWPGRGQAIAPTMDEVVARRSIVGATLVVALDGLSWDWST